MVDSLRIVDKEGKKIDTIDFGLVAFGEDKRLSLQIHNPNDFDYFDVNVRLSDNKIIVVQKPTHVAAHTKAELVLSWDALESLKKNPVQLILEGKFTE